MIQFKEINEIVGGRVLKSSHEMTIQFLLTDSRKLIYAPTSLFFAIGGTVHDGHDYLDECYKKGVRMFIVEEEIQLPGNDIHCILVEDAIIALQKLSAFHRKQFDYEVVALTGSNGKTIVKEWLSFLIQDQVRVVANPKSYNSRIGVPLSLWQMDHQHQVAIFETGISKKGDMRILEKIVKPTWGIFTNLGSAHDAGFASMKEKAHEKVQLFYGSQQVIYCADYPEIHNAMQADELRMVKKWDWSFSQESTIGVHLRMSIQELTISLNGRDHKFDCPYTNLASVENLVHCLVFCLLNGLTKDLNKKISLLPNVQMRLLLKKGQLGSMLVDDSYSNDFGGLSLALDFMNQQAGKDHQGSKLLILSDVQESALTQKKLYRNVSAVAKAKGISKIIGIGSQISQNANLFEIPITCFPTTEAFLEKFQIQGIKDAFVLVKGGRAFRFERISKLLEQQSHRTHLEVRLADIVDNLNFYRAKLNRDVKLMVMVKAFAYGSGFVQIARLLEFYNVDYLCVAYADEGVTLRNAGINVPIMVMNSSEDDFENLVSHRLEPEIYSFRLLKSWIAFDAFSKPPIHLKIETGMNRLGFVPEEVDEMISLISKEKIKVASIFSHLAAADDADEYAFSRQQYETFQQVLEVIDPDENVLFHILNSAGIVRFPEMQLDMVRLGIGLYGIEASGMEAKALVPALAFKSYISQIKEVEPGQTVGYARRGKVNRKKLIGTVAVGYADGFDRRNSNGVGKVLINGKEAPVIGNVCMDMCMVDLTGITCKEGDEVILFGPEFPIENLANRIGTISYEVLTSISPRVKRTYIQ